MEEVNAQVKLLPHDVLRKYGYKLLIDLKRTSGVWRWGDGDVLDWAGDWLDEEGYYFEDCAYIDWRGGWGTRRCDDDWFNYICETGNTFSLG